MPNIGSACGRRALAARAGVGPAPGPAPHTHTLVRRDASTPVPAWRGGRHTCVTLLQYLHIRDASYAIYTFRYLLCIYQAALEFHEKMLAFLSFSQLF